MNENPSTTECTNDNYRLYLNRSRGLWESLIWIFDNDFLLHKCKVRTSVSFESDISFLTNIMRYRAFFVIKWQAKHFFYPKKSDEEGTFYTSFC